MILSNSNELPDNNGKPKRTYTPKKPHNIPIIIRLLITSDIKTGAIIAVNNG